MKDFFEQNLEDIIFDNRHEIHERGFCEMGKVNFRQFTLPSTKRIDIISYSACGYDDYVNVIELKRDVVDQDALLQAIGYVSELKASFVSLNKVLWQITLVGRSFRPIPLIDFLNTDIQIVAFTYNYDIDGIRFTPIEISSPKHRGIRMLRSSLRAIQYKVIPENECFYSNLSALIDLYPEIKAMIDMCVKFNLPISDVIRKIDELNASSYTKELVRQHHFPTIVGFN